jgi:hypothetical protein
VALSDLQVNRRASFKSPAHTVLPHSSEVL